MEGPKCVAKLLYIGKHSARPDKLTAICFLATRVTVTDEDDWKKLKRVLTISLMLMLMLTANASCLFEASF